MAAFDRAAHRAKTPWPIGLNTDDLSVPGIWRQRRGILKDVSTPHSGWTM